MNRQYFSFSNNFTAIDGNGITFQISAYPTLDGISVFSQDITEQRRTNNLLRAREEKYANTFQHAPSIVTLTALEDGKYLDINEKFCKFLGLIEMS